MYWMGVSRVLRGRFLCTGWMFLMRLPLAWYAGYLTLLIAWSTLQLKPFNLQLNLHYKWCYDYKCYYLSARGMYTMCISNLWLDQQCGKH